MFSALFLIHNLPEKCSKFPSAKPSIHQSTANLRVLRRTLGRGGLRRTSWFTGLQNLDESLKPNSIPEWKIMGTPSSSTLSYMGYINSSYGYQWSGIISTPLTSLEKTAHSKIWTASLSLGSSQMKPIILSGASPSVGQQ